MPSAQTGMVILQETQGQKTQILGLDSATIWLYDLEEGTLVIGIVTAAAIYHCLLCVECYKIYFTSFFLSLINMIERYY